MSELTPEEIALIKAADEDCWRGYPHMLLEAEQHRRVLLSHIAELQQLNESKDRQIECLQELCEQASPPPNDLLSRYEAWIKTIPVGEEHAGHGSSAYNWHRAALRKLRELSAEPAAAPEDVQKNRLIEVRDDKIVNATMKAPGLPDGLHDLFCADPREVRPLPVVETSKDQMAADIGPLTVAALVASETGEGQ